MNHTQLKERLVTNTFILNLIFVLICFSCEEKRELESSNDTYLLSLILEKNREEIMSNEIQFISKNDNNYAIKVLKDYRENIEIGDSLKLNELIQSIGLNRFYKEKRSMLKEVLENKDELEYLISQSQNSEWNTSLIDSMYLKTKKKSIARELKISKPIYTKNNQIAFIGINKGSTLSIGVYLFEGEKWKELGLIAPVIIQKETQEIILNSN